MRTYALGLLVACSSSSSVIEPSELEASFDLLDDRGVLAGDAIALGEDLGLTARGLEGDAPYRIVVGDAKDGDRELFAIAVHADRDGALERSLVLPDLGLGDDRDDPWFATRDLDRAAKGLAGRYLRISIEAGGERMRSRVVEVIASGHKPQIVLFDERGVTRGADVKTPVRVVGRGLAPGKARLLLTADRREWRTGDTIDVATTRDGTPLSWRVDIDDSGTLEHAIDLTGVIPGPYQVAIYPGTYKKLPPLDHRYILGKPLAPALHVLDPNFEPLPGHGGAGTGVAIQIADLSARGNQHADLFTANEPVSARYVIPNPFFALPVSLGRKARLYTIAHRELGDWQANPPLVDVGGRVVETILTLAGTAGSATLGDFPLGRYDVVLDKGNRATAPSGFVADDRFDAAHDVVDGVTRVGFTVAREPGVRGTYHVGETSYTLPDLPLVSTSSPANIDVPVVGEVRYPATAPGLNERIAPGTFPVVLVAHGVGLPYRGYDGLLAHLASHGYIAISIDMIHLQTQGPPADIRAQLILHHLAALVDPARQPGPIAGHVDSTNLSLIGHSRGGDAVLRVAHITRRDHLPFSLRAIIGVAPTDTTAQTDPSVAAVPYLGIYGTADRDIGAGHGFAFGSHQNGTAFRAFDRQLGPRAMVFVQHACHNPFNEFYIQCEEPNAAIEPHLPPTFTLLSADEHLRLLHGYATAFLERHARGDMLMDVYFTEAILPGTIAAVRRDVANPRREVLTGPMFTRDATATTDTLWRLDVSSPHTAVGTLLRTVASGGELRIATAPIDASRMTDPVVAIRVGQPVGMLTRSLASDATIAEFDAGTFSTHYRPWIELDNHIPGPGARITTEVPGVRWLIEDGAHRARIIKQLVPRYVGWFDISFRNPAFAEHHEPTPIRVRVTDTSGRSRAISAVIEPSWVPEASTTDPLFHIELRTLAALSALRIPVAAFAIPDFSGPGIDPRRISGIAIEVDGESELLIADVAIAPGP